MTKEIFEYKGYKIFLDLEHKRDFITLTSSNYQWSQVPKDCNEIYCHPLDYNAVLEMINKWKHPEEFAKKLLDIIDEE